MTTIVDPARPFALPPGYSVEEVADSVQLGWVRGGEGWVPASVDLSTARQVARDETAHGARERIDSLLQSFGAETGLPDTMSPAELGDYANSLAIFISNADRVYAAAHPGVLVDPAFDGPRWALLSLQQGIAAIRAREAANLAMVQALFESGDAVGLGLFSPNWGAE